MEDFPFVQEGFRMMSPRFIHLLVILTIASAANLSILKGSLEAEQGRLCEGALVQNLGSSQCGTVLRICMEGVAYKTAEMDKERLIRSQDVTAWKYFGPRRTEDDAVPQEYVSLQIWEYRGKKHRFNIGCGEAADGQNVFQSMKRYQPRGMLY